LNASDQFEISTLNPCNLLFLKFKYTLHKTLLFHFVLCQVGDVLTIDTTQGAVSSFLDVSSRRVDNRAMW